VFREIFQASETEYLSVKEEVVYGSELLHYFKNKVLGQLDITFLLGTLFVSHVLWS